MATGTEPNPIAIVVLTVTRSHKRLFTTLGPLLGVIFLAAESAAAPAPAGRAAADEPAGISTDIDDVEERWSVTARPLDGYRPALSIAEPIRSDGLPRQLVRRLVRDALFYVAPCYRRALRPLPQAARSMLAGSLDVRLMLTTQGRVAHVITDGLVSDDISGCMTTTLRRLRFPKPRSCGLAIVQLKIELGLDGVRSEVVTREVTAQ